MSALYVPALAVAFLVTLLELTEVVALVFALSADRATVRPGVYGAVSGAVVVTLVAVGFGFVLLALPHGILLWGAAVVLAGFGIFLFRSTLRSYRWAGHPPRPSDAGHARLLQFSGGFSVGVVEVTEAMIVLLALTAAGYGTSALVGAATAALILTVAAALVHDRIRRIKVPWLKLGGTSLLFAFATFWAGEAAGVAWPGGDLFLIPLAVAAGLLARGAIALWARPVGPPPPSPAGPVV